MKFLQIVLVISSLFLISCKKDLFFADVGESKIASLEEEGSACRKLAITKDSFYSCEGKIFDASGSEFIHRGVNMPLAYFKSQSKADISKVVKAGFNSVRVLWCADTLYAGGRCDGKDMHDISELDEYLTVLESNNLVSVLNLQNATGRDDKDSLAKIVDYLIKDEIKTVLNKHKRNLQINIANEWHGTWANRSEGGKKWYDAYKTQLARLRSAGLEHQFVIDTCGWGQDPSCIYNYGEKLLEEDSNIVFSAHVYDSLGKNKDNVIKLFDFVREKNVPFLVGEFASTHYGKTVAWETVIDESDREGSKYGFIAWSWSGNSSSLKSLDIIERSEFGKTSDLESGVIRGLTDFGKSLLEYNGGLKNYSLPACTLESTALCLRNFSVNSTEKMILLELNQSTLIILIDDSDFPSVVESKEVERNFS